jgi:prepilin-type processing-associated H-X9-DG protein
MWPDWASRTSLLTWRALLLPFIEGGNTYNALNLDFGPYANTADPGAGYTAWTTHPGSVWLCPSDGKNDNGFRPWATYTNGGCPYQNPNGQTTIQTPPINPMTGQITPMIPITNYGGSHGDNYAGGILCDCLPWETPSTATVPVGQVRFGWPGYWGTNWSAGFADHSGSLRGFFDYSTNQIASINSATDGTSNTIIVGEVLPSKRANLQFYVNIGATAGTTVPLGWDTNTFPATDPNCNCQWENTTAPLGCRFSAAAEGFRSEHPGGANFAFADGSVHFLKKTISLATYNALGSRNGGEVISSGAY